MFDVSNIFKNIFYFLYLLFSVYFCLPNLFLFHSHNFFTMGSILLLFEFPGCFFLLWEGGSQLDDKYSKLSSYLASIRCFLHYFSTNCYSDLLSYHTRSCLLDQSYNLYDDAYRFFIIWVSLQIRQNHNRFFNNPNNAFFLCPWESFLVWE